MLESLTCTLCELQIEFEITDSLIIDEKLDLKGRFKIPTRHDDELRISCNRLILF